LNAELSIREHETESVLPEGTEGRFSIEHDDLV